MQSLSYVLVLLVSSVLCQQGNHPASNANYNFQNHQPPPQIISHKQALNHDGNFKYLFTSENGLAQGESIAPDGSRSGAYSYVDPTGRKISVKYTAGKEGFRILEADHLPKAPLPIAPLPQPAPYVATGAANGPYDDGQYRPDYQAQYSGLQGRPAVQYPAPIAHSAPHSYQQERDIDYNDEPGKAHSFGTGYLFEFGG